SDPRWMLWTGRLFSFVVVAQLLSSAWFRATHHTYAVAEIVTSYGYPESAIVQDRKSTRLNSSHLVISYAVFCLKKKKQDRDHVHVLFRNFTCDCVHPQLLFTAGVACCTLDPVAPIAIAAVLCLGSRSNYSRRAT